MQCRNCRQLNINLMLDNKLTGGMVLDFSPSP